ncbi:MAG: DNA-directed RNA polymerase subunit alpha C-terminal domain-containing protein [Sedimentisphaerales bacterium]|nr:DNA-directed RNA polymerase subunit alpha C-terminal domain-containing protein [Sedimentisphaerales bacterium]
MAATAVAKADLFGTTNPSMEQIGEMALLVHSSEGNRIAFAKQLETHLEKNDAATSLIVGVGLYLLGNYNAAIPKLEKAKDSQQKCFYLAWALRRVGRYDDALVALDKARSQQADQLKVTLERAATLRHAGRLDQAAKELKSCANFERISAEYHHQLGRLKDAQGLYDEAMKHYCTAIELEPSHQSALFHLAYECDLHGDDEDAVDYYQQIVSNSPVYTSALLNLAILHEDMGEYDKAAQCIDAVLVSHPNHPRALLFNKDIESSKTMFYDEERERKMDRRNQILEIPISDFELSVRSRNCLRKMNIRTIGDLLRTTEVELLAYKNFGETSLTEIKSILNSKNLRLGMAIEDKTLAAQKTDATAANASDELLSKTVEDFEMSVRAKKCLQRLNIRTIGEIVSRTEAELLGCKNFGVTSLNEIKQKLTLLGLSLRNLD